MNQTARRGWSAIPQLLAAMTALLAATVFAVLVFCAPAHAATAMASHNLEWHNYYVTSHPIFSHLEKTVSGYQRVEWDRDSNALVVENYSDAFALKSTATVSASTYKPSDLPSGSTPVWGGYLATPNANYVVTGQANRDEEDNRKVVRVTKYSKDWKYISHCEISSINTVYPFNAGSLSMVEQGGKLWIRTCHTMYKSSDGLNHQASMLFTIDPSSMKLLGKYASVMNISHTGWGYVSHSFNQLLTVANGTVYSLDHGDAYPRAIVAKQLADEDYAITPYRSLWDISGSVGNNYTGVNVGGFEYSAAKDNLIAVISSTDQAKLDTSETYNAHVLIAKGDLSSKQSIPLTSYAEGSLGVTNPHLIKINDNKFLVAWQTMSPVKHQSKIDGTIYFQYIDGNGSKLGKVYSAPGYLSECQPVVVGSKIVWYTTGKYKLDNWGYIDMDKTAPVFYTLDTSSNTVTASNDRISLAKASITVGAKVYTGKALSPSVTVKLNGKTLTKNVDYTVKYSNNKYVGKATVTITGKGKYKDSAKKTFNINPKSTAISKLVGGKKAVTVKWKKQTAQTTGYQIRYSTSSAKDKSGKLKTGKTVKVAKSKLTSKTIKKLKGGKKYYVQIRTYKTVKGATYYSSWSKPKAVKTKK